MTLISLILATAGWAGPIDLSTYGVIDVAYTMTTQGTVSCETSYVGTGAVKEVEGGRITFEGQWTVTSDTCGGNTVWFPKDGAAFHTLRLTEDGKKIEEWVVHGNAADHARFESQIKERGQYWINELGLSVSKKGAMSYKTTETHGIGPASIDIRHQLAISLTAASADG